MAKSGQILPWEIVEQILSRVEPKPLLRFLCVSRAWYTTISSPNFTLNYSKRRLVFFLSPRNSTVTYEEDAEDQLEIVSVRKHGNLDIIKVSANKIDWPHMFYRDSVRVLTSYKGLFLFIHRTSLYLFNPTTRRCEKVLTSPYREEELASGGICYDRSSGDHKVVVVSRSTLPITIQAASLKTKQWKEIQFPYKLLGWDSHAVFVNDKLHWLMVKDDGPAGGGFTRKFKVVTCFDAEEDKFIEFLIPPHASRDNGAYITGVTVVGGCLALSCYEGTSIYLWVMKEYGKEESWTLLYNEEMIDPHVKSIVPIVESGKMFVASFADGMIHTRYYKEDDDGREEYTLDTAIPYEQSMFFPIHTLIN